MLSLIGRCRDGKGHKCDRDGVMRLIAPDGLVVPGVTMCREHAEECIREYAEKLGERWTMLDVRTDERIDLFGDTLPAKDRLPPDPLTEVLDALEALVSAQNGPPLIRDEAEWSKAMGYALAILAKHGRTRG